MSRSKAALWGIAVVGLASFVCWGRAAPDPANAAAGDAPTTRTAYIEVKGMIQQLGIT